MQASVHKYCTNPTFRDKIERHIENMIADDNLPSKKAIYYRNIVCQLIKDLGGEYNYVPQREVADGFLKKAKQDSLTKASVDIFGMNFNAAIMEMKFELLIQGSNNNRQVKIQYPIEALLDFHYHFIVAINEQLSKPKPEPIPVAFKPPPAQKKPPPPKQVQQEPLSSDDDFDFPNFANPNAIHASVQHSEKIATFSDHYYRKPIQEPDYYVKVEMLQYYKNPLMAKHEFGADLEQWKQTGVCDGRVPASQIGIELKYSAHTNRAAREEAKAKAIKEWIKNGRKGPKPTARMEQPRQNLMGLGLDNFGQDDGLTPENSGLTCENDGLSMNSVNNGLNMNSVNNGFIQNHMNAITDDRPCSSIADSGVFSWSGNSTGTYNTRRPSSAASNQLSHGLSTMTLTEPKPTVEWDSDDEEGFVVQQKPKAKPKPTQKKTAEVVKPVERPVRDGWQVSNRRQGKKAWS